MALTGHSGSQAPQSMHSFGSMNSLRSVPSSKWMQSTGQTDTHDTSSTSMHGSAITYAIQEPPRGSPDLAEMAPRGTAGPEGTTGRLHEAVPAPSGTTQCTGICMPRAQCPGMWQPTSHGV